MITISHLTKIFEGKGPRVTACENMKESKKLLKLTVFDGERERTILSGIAKWYKPEDLAG